MMDKRSTSTSSGCLAASLQETSTTVPSKISVNENNGCSQSEKLNIKSVCEKGGKMWRPQLGRARKLAEDPLCLELQNPEALSSTYGAEDVDKMENDDETDFDNYSDCDMSDSDFLPLEPRRSPQLSECGPQLFTEKEDWEKEIDEAYPYDEDDLEIFFRAGCSQVQPIFQDEKIYNPSCDHAPSLTTGVIEIPLVQGQFEDADEK
ncbi:uncharacterized protein LOC103182132 [Callorhinchus milii]|uniref:uncharacterized protein LOC103182132 n=1 Tax=Callorhinchus milii TaxID=7868 RepID=UPI000457293A|nr:uncharacterized protein LOC103182132 [Callorhinchus milii]|eukprot:gi/632962229/ref/XP_007897193.1/ PREDICTED: uncharacterized protein LOC103182132 [Callorhinchus milii]